MIEYFRAREDGRLGPNATLRLENRFASIVDGSAFALDPGEDSDSALYTRVGQDVPVRELPRMYADLNAPAGATDVVFVTDARVRLPADVRDRFAAWKAAAKARLVTLVIDHPPGDLARVSDEVHPVRTLAPDADAVGRVLSL